MIILILIVLIVGTLFTWLSESKAVKTWALLLGCVICMIIGYHCIPYSEFTTEPITNFHQKVISTKYNQIKLVSVYSVYNEEHNYLKTYIIEDSNKVEIHRELNAIPCIMIESKPIPEVICTIFEKDPHRYSVFLRDIENVEVK